MVFVFISAFIERWKDSCANFFWSWQFLANFHAERSFFDNKKIFLTAKNDGCNFFGYLQGRLSLFLTFIAIFFILKKIPKLFWAQIFFLSVYKYKSIIMTTCPLIFSIGAPRYRYQFFQSRFLSIPIHPNQHYFCNDI